MTTLRVLSYNVRSLRDDPAAVARVIRAAAPDVVCIQEAPKWWRWRSRCAALARESGLLVISGGLPAGHNLLLCSVGVDVSASDDVLLSRRFGLHQRGLTTAACSLGGVRFRVAATHLDLDAAERRRHVEEIFAGLDESSGPVILGADVNEPAGSPAWAALATRLPECEATGGTYPAAGAERRIDGIFASRDIGVRSAVVLDSADVRLGSDHRPVLAQLELP